MPYTESSYENAIIQLFEEMGYTHAYGPDIERDYKVPYYADELTAALYRLNPSLPDDAISDALYKLTNYENGELVQKNAVFMDYLQNGVEVRYTEKGEERSALCYLVDYSNIARLFAILLTIQTLTTTPLLWRINGRILKTRKNVRMCCCLSTACLWC